MKQTAVEFLVDEFKQKLIGDNLPDWVVNIIEQAKEMEKQQTIDFAMKFMMQDRPIVSFYNKTFKSE